MKKFTFCFLAVWVTGIFIVSQGWASPKRETPIVEVVREWGPNVVNIGTEKVALLRHHPFWRGYGNEMDAVFQNFFGPQYVSAVKIKSIGSGVILTKEGLIVTNAHVVNMASQMFVTLNDGKSVAGTVVFMDQKNDLALVKIDPPETLKDMKLAETKDVWVGETAIAIGNPLGLENSVSVGVISGKSRRFEVPKMNVAMDELIQTDAAINAGNSGGGLLNLDGELVGVNLAVVQNASNIGFAVSSDKIKALLEAYRAQPRQEQSSGNSFRIPVR